MADENRSVPTPPRDPFYPADEPCFLRQIKCDDGPDGTGECLVQQGNPGTCARTTLKLSHDHTFAPIHRFTEQPSKKKKKPDTHLIPECVAAHPKRGAPCCVMGNLDAP